MTFTPSPFDSSPHQSTIREGRELGELTLTSMRSTSDHAWIAALLEAYTPAQGVGMFPTIEPMLITSPDFSFAI